MKTWFNSLNGAVTLSVIALLTELWRAFLDSQHQYSNFLDSTGAVLLVTLLYTAFFGGWAWALLRAMRGGRSALILRSSSTGCFCLFCLSARWSRIALHRVSGFSPCLNWQIESTCSFGC